MAQDLYRNRDLIPDFDAIMAETAARSREFAARVDLRADIPYGPGPRERLDLLLPARPRRGAALHLFLHGGYWRSGSKEDHHLIAAPVLAAGGICAIATYGLMPGTRLGAILAQVRAAALHLTDLAPGLGADPQRFTVSGHSAGAHLASYLAARSPAEARPARLPLLRGLFLMSGLYDLSEIPGSFLKPETGMTPDEAEAWSPLNAAHDPAPLRIIACGEAETRPFHDQARAMLAKLDQADPPTRYRSEFRTEPGLNHLTTVLALGDPNSAAGARLAALVEAS